MSGQDRRWKCFSSTVSSSWCPSSIHPNYAGSCAAWTRISGARRLIDCDTGGLAALIILALTLADKTPARLDLSIGLAMTAALVAIATAVER